MRNVFGWRTAAVAIFVFAQGASAQDLARPRASNIIVPQTGIVPAGGQLGIHIERGSVGVLQEAIQNLGADGIQMAAADGRLQELVDGAVCLSTEFGVLAEDIARPSKSRRRLSQNGHGEATCVRVSVGAPK